MLYQEDDRAVAKEKHQSLKIDSYNSFNSRAYISEYYSSLGDENTFLLNFYHDTFKDLPEGLSMLELGGGPTVYQLFSASRKTTEIVFTDYLSKNLKEVASWLAKEPGFFSWEKFSRTVAELENSGKADLLHETVKVEERTRAAVKQLLGCDALSEAVVPRMAEKKFDIVSSGFCLECISCKEGEFVKAISNAVRLIKPSGYMVLTLLKNSRSYKIAGNNFPAFPVDSEYLKKLFPELGLKISEFRESSAEQEQGYEGLIALVARKAP